MFKGSKLQLKIATLLVEVISILAMAVVAIAVVFTFFFRNIKLISATMIGIIAYMIEDSEAVTMSIPTVSKI